MKHTSNIVTGSQVYQGPSISTMMKGHAPFVSSGYVYAPYIPVQVTPVVSTNRRIRTIWEFAGAFLAVTEYTDKEKIFVPQVGNVYEWKSGALILVLQIGIEPVSGITTIIKMLESSGEIRSSNIRWGYVMPIEGWKEIKL